MVLCICQAHPSVSAVSKSSCGYRYEIFTQITLFIPESHNPLTYYGFIGLLLLLNTTDKREIFNMHLIKDLNFDVNTVTYYGSLWDLIT